VIKFINCGRTYEKEVIADNEKLLTFLGVQVKKL
jgi:hypothetical protein